MSHTYSKLYYHCVFSTKNHLPFLQGNISEELDSYLVGIARNNDMFLVRSGGVADHRHLLLELKPKITVSDAMRLLKTNSSKWIRETYPELSDFGWQTGYSTFSVSASGKENVAKYIDGQAEHHRKMSFEEELRVLFERHGIEFEPSLIRE